MLRRLLYLYPEILGYIKLWFYKLAFGRDFQFKGKIRFSSKADIRIRKHGKMIMEDESGISDGNIIRVTDSGKLTLKKGANISQTCIVVCQSEINIGEYTSIGPHCAIFDHDHDYKTHGLINRNGCVAAPILIEDNVWIGSNCTILKGITIGTGSIVAAGSVITKDIPPHTLYYAKGTKVFKPLVS